MRKDIDFNFTMHPLSNDLSVKKDRRAVEQSMKSLVLTNFYERGFNVEIGANVKASLFENITSLTQQTIKDNITQVLTNFEPDVELVDVKVSKNGDNSIVAEIFYNIFNDPEIRNVVIPLQRLR